VVMWFNVKEAREQLINKGFVFTLRPKLRREGHEILMYKDFGKKGDLWVSFISDITSASMLNKFVEWSGFDSVGKWLIAAKEAQYLYLVVLMEVEKSQD